MAIQDGKALYNALNLGQDLDEALKKFNEVRLKQVRRTQLLAKVRNTL